MVNIVMHIFEILLEFFVSVEVGIVLLDDVDGVVMLEAAEIAIKEISLVEMMLGVVEESG